MGSEIIEVAGDVTTYTFSKLRADQQYKFRLQAHNSVGESPFCKPVSVITRNLPPVAPELSVGKVTHCAFKVSWTGGSE
jgi:hypothetical protein